MRIGDTRAPCIIVLRSKCENMENVKMYRVTRVNIYLCHCLTLQLDTEMHFWEQLQNTERSNICIF